MLLSEGSQDRRSMFRMGPASDKDVAWNPGPHRHPGYTTVRKRACKKPPFCFASLPTVVGKITTQNSEPRVPFLILFLTAKNVEVLPGAGWACQGTNTRQSPAWGSSTSQKRRRGREMDEDFLVQKSLTPWPKVNSPLWTKWFSFLFFGFPFFCCPRFAVEENTSLLPCGSNTAQGASGKRGMALICLHCSKEGMYILAKQYVSSERCAMPKACSVCHHGNKPSSCRRRFPCKMLVWSSSST